MNLPIPNEDEEIQKHLDEQRRIALRALCLAQMHIIHTITKGFEAESHQPLTTKEIQHANVSCIPNDVIEELETLNCTQPVKETAQIVPVQNALHSATEHVASLEEPLATCIYSDSKKNMSKNKIYSVAETSSRDLFLEYSLLKNPRRFDFYPFPQNQHSRSETNDKILHQANISYVPVE